MIAMALARRPTDSVHKEYKVDSVARASNTKGLAIDVVYIQSTTSVKQPQQVILSAVHEYEILSSITNTISPILTGTPFKCRLASLGRILD